MIAAAVALHDGGGSGYAACKTEPSRLDWIECLPSIRCAALYVLLAELSSKNLK
jgi:hypothetical protein